MRTSIIQFTQLSQHEDYRWDGEYLCFEPYKNSELKYRTIGSILKNSQYGISVEMNEDGNGSKIYRMNEIHGMFCDSDVSKFAEISANEKKQFKLNDRDVLFNRTNSQIFVGRTGIYRKFSSEDFVFASYLIRVVPDENIILPEYLAAFLNTKYGILDVQRRARISINQSNVNAEELKRVEIPLLGERLQSKIKNAFDNAYLCIKDAEKIYRDTENTALKEVNLDRWTPKHKLTFIDNFSETRNSQRLDAEHFQPKYDEIENAIKNYNNGWSVLKENFEPNKSKFTKVENQEYEYLEIGGVDVSNGEIETLSLTGKELPANAKIKLKKDDVVISKVRTYRGAVAIIDRNDIIGSGAFVVLHEKGTINKETLFVLLRSLPYLEYSLKFNSGTSYPVLGDEDVLNYPLPLIKKNIQNWIKQNIEKSLSLKRKSISLREFAKRSIEIAIEENEKSAYQWLEHKLAEAEK